MARKNTVYPQVDLGRWSPGNRWVVELHIDNGGNIVRMIGSHVGPGPAARVEDWTTHQLDVRPFDDLLAQLRTTCIEAAAAGVQLRLPGMQLG